LSWIKSSNKSKQTPGIRARFKKNPQNSKRITNKALYFKKQSLSRTKWLSSKPNSKVFLTCYLRKSNAKANF